LLWGAQLYRIARQGSVHWDNVREFQELELCAQWSAQDWQAAFLLSFRIKEYRFILLYS
jgi:hypothetical protein